ncbi:hypothetical protein FVEG_17562 [Fusarium verticillioides 7600]|uniref:Zn(2)-C6 fungal-type domain-containing protein n=1 Tax=Gibberella moniliformis (strain M3125 / FGSC 7600) TaxID=334819 RepID=W7NGR2_GIBM7|nr:hypothetical protein FVEG_17562 [Fusarium verticillioides 7600]EWG55632.1 hypothetical protein FVEG_17562 [Fusarium verticillioides 7600]
MPRPLLPGPVREESQSASHSPLLVASLTRRRRPITLACELCRQHKSRCDGGKPRCSQCARRQMECHYRTSLNTRERIRNIPHSGDEVADIVRRIQSGQDVESILGHIQRADLLKQAHVVPDHYYQYEFPYGKDMPSFLIQEGNQP